MSNSPAENGRKKTVGPNGARLGDGGNIANLSDGRDAMGKWRRSGKRSMLVVRAGRKEIMGEESIVCAGACVMFSGREGKKLQQVIRFGPCLSSVDWKAGETHSVKRIQAWARNRSTVRQNDITDDALPAFTDSRGETGASGGRRGEVLTKKKEKYDLQGGKKAASFFL